MRAWIVTLTLLAATPAWACMNDRETVVQEEEVRGRYHQEAPPEVEQPSLWTYAPAVGTSLAGLLLLGAAFKLTPGKND